MHRSEDLKDTPSPLSLKVKKEVKMLVAQSCPTLCNPMDCVAHQAPLSMGFPRQEYWSGLHSFLQRIFLILGLNLGLLHCSWFFSV